MLSVDDVNRLTRAAFVQLLGGVFEHSPWVADRAFDRRPFASRDSLHEAMVGVVQAASRAEQLGLLNAHPELAGREAQAGALTSASTSEQASAGLTNLSRPEIERIAALNSAYRAKFGFPFIIAVRDHTKADIFAELQRRSEASFEDELETCLGQVYRITAMRLPGIIAE
jgi:2-oxo-4-hydroxy-4-carboxy-5-ureidoimidazoline decarboxylase